MVCHTLPKTVRCDTTGPQTPEHLLQSCPLASRSKTSFSTGQFGQRWLTKLWGSKEDLMTTTNFINGARLPDLEHGHKKAEEEEEKKEEGMS